MISRMFNKSGARMVNVGVRMIGSNPYSYENMKKNDWLVNDSKVIYCLCSVLMICVILYGCIVL